MEDICAVYRHALTVNLYPSLTAVRPCVRTRVLKHILTKTLLTWYNTRSSVLWGWSGSPQWASLFRCTSSCKICSPLLTLWQPPWPSAEWAGVGTSWNLHPCGPQICLIRALCALLKGSIDIIGSFSFNFFDNFTGRRLVLRQYMCQLGWPQRNCERRGSSSVVLIWHIEATYHWASGDLQTP